VKKRGVGTPFPCVPTPLHPWFRLKPHSNFKYRSDALACKKLPKVSQSTRAICNLLRNSLKTWRLIFLWNEDSGVTINANNEDEAWSTQIPLLMSQTVITQPCYGAIYEITCGLFIDTAPGSTRRKWNRKSKSSSNVTTSAKRCGNAVQTQSHSTTPCSHQL